MATKKLPVKPLMVRDDSFKLIDVEGDEAEKKELDLDSIRSSMSSRASHAEVGMELFRMGPVVGKGSFGEVLRVEHRQTHKSYAMKVIKKQKVFQEEAVEMVLREKDILQSVLGAHPFIVTLHFAFQTPYRIFLGMNFVGGGTLKHLLRRRGRLEEASVRFYTAELILALEHMHRQNVIHRDLKLDNVMLTHEGHIQLTDFGMARTIKGGLDLATTHCGTPEYLPFEVVQSLVKRKKDGYGKTADWWSLGIAIYEMLVGRTPFVSEERDTRMTVFNIYSHTRITIPDKIPVSADLRSLVEALLQKDPEKRLGRGGAAELKAHAFFADLDWDACAACDMEPPFRMPVQSYADRRVPTVEELMAPIISREPFVAEEAERLERELKPFATQEVLYDPDGAPLDDSDAEMADASSDCTCVML
eukprot:PLAT4992.1.p1 GENE.PLAT4992.1~~PLAT4992.1.p1  ORF type:complete len:428 (-),score=187.14 PLAT4992.1:316-1569(-)